jgi:sec-independent protein translocase protein TatB
LFGIGPFELLVLAIVGLLVLGPERLPGYARQAAQVLRTLRDLATGAEKQLRDELGPEFADVDLRNLNPRHVVRRAIFDDDFDFDSLDPRKRARGAIIDDDMRAADPRTWLRDDRTRRSNGSANGRVNGNGRGEYVDGTPVSMTKPVSAPMRAPVPPTPSSGLGVPQTSVNGSERPRPRPSPRPRPVADDDIT